MKIVPGLCIAAAVMLGGNFAATAAVLGNCNAAMAMRYTSSILDNSQTASLVFSAIPEGTVNFMQGHTGCVVVTFTAQINSGSNRLGLRAYLDNTTVGHPFEVVLAESISATETRTVVFVFSDVAAGAHTLKMQFSSPDAATVTVMRHVTMVQYTK